MRRLGALLAPVTLLLTSLTVGATPSAYAEATRPAVVERQVIGHSIKGRPIRAFRLGRQAPGNPTVVLISTMHGDERDTRGILDSLIGGRPVRGVDLWVVPVQNPDGWARRSRQNARGVDLNRNYPHRWIHQDGRYESGGRPASEPETRATMDFLSRVRPDWVLSFHQPLLGVDTDTKRPAFARRVARALDLPRKRFTCNGGCHGTMTMWFNHHFRGAALTVEYGENPSRALMRQRAPRQVLSLFGARR